MNNDLYMRLKYVQKYAYIKYKDTEEVSWVSHLGTISSLINAT